MLNDYAYGSISRMMIVIILILVASWTHAHSVSWISDSEFLEIVGRQIKVCDIVEFPENCFDNVDCSNYLLEFSTSHPDQAFIVRGKKSDPLGNEVYSQGWSKASLLERFGQVGIRVGSGSAIVNSGGGSDIPTTFAGLIAQLNSSSASAIMFEPTILSMIPSLKEQFNIPKFVQAWDSWDAELEGDMWHFLSLGPSKQGLPFHNHGKTWITTIGGRKLWFLYPLGFGPPERVYTDNVFEWYKDVFPNLANLPVPLINSSNEITRTSLDDYKPLTCLQEPGDTLLIPQLWLHMTINVGETIAIGGQELLLDEDRRKGAVDALRHHPQDPIAMKDLGLAALNSGFRLFERFKDELSALGAAEAGDNIWKVNISDAGPTAVFQQLQRRVLSLSGNSAIIIYTEHCCSEEQIKNIKSAVNLDTDVFIFVRAQPLTNTQQCTNDSQEFFQLERIYFYHGVSVSCCNGDVDCVSSKELDEIEAELQTLSTNTTLLPLLIGDLTGNVSVGVTSIKSFLDQIHFCRGSISGLPVAVRLKWTRARLFVRNSLQVRPFQPDSIAILLDILTQLDEREELLRLLMSAEMHASSLHAARQMSNTTFASFMFQLTSASSKAGFFDEAVMLSLRSVQANYAHNPAAEMIQHFLGSADSCHAARLLSLHKFNLPTELRERIQTVEGQALCSETTNSVQGG